MRAITFCLENFLKNLFDWKMNIVIFHEIISSSQKSKFHVVFISL